MPIIVYAYSIFVINYIQLSKKLNRFFHMSFITFTHFILFYIEMSDSTSASTSASTSNLELTTSIKLSIKLSITLSNDIIDRIVSKLSYPTIYSLYLEGNAICHNYLLTQGKKTITLLEECIHPDSGYYPIEDDFDFTNLDKIIKKIWNIIICLSTVFNPNLPANMLSDACAFILMEYDLPESYSNMVDDIWDSIIVRYLDSEYDETTNSWLEGYKKWKYICCAIDEYPHIHALHTAAKQKHALAILIMTYREHKDEIMHMYEHEYEQIDTDKKYYNELKSLIRVVSGNGHLGVEMVPNQFVKDTFYFMSRQLDYN